MNIQIKVAAAAELFARILQDLRCHIPDLRWIRWSLAERKDQERPCAVTGEGMNFLLNDDGFVRQPRKPNVFIGFRHVIIFMS